jgi:hypothetical protein
MGVRAILLALCTTTVAVGCGSRTQIDLPFADEDAGADASLDGDAATDVSADTTPDAEGDADADGAGGDAGSDAHDGAGGRGGGGPLGCFQCLGSNCPSAMQCLQDTACRNGAVCVFTKCLAGGGGSGGGMGGIDYQCLLGCFNGDLNAGLQAFQTFQCIMQQCGNDCGSLLGGLGGGGIPGLPGGGGGGAKDGG